MLSEQERDGLTTALEVLALVGGYTREFGFLLALRERLEKVEPVAEVVAPMYSGKSFDVLWDTHADVRPGMKLYLAPPAADGRDALSMFDQCVAEELPRVSHVEYDSHEICKHFAEKVRERIAALARAKGGGA